MTETAKVVWKGPKGLRRFLVPVDDLEPFPGNPRRGDVQSIADSLNRFGQLKPILVAGGDVGKIVAGHHVRLGAIELGWSHVAVMEHEFADAQEARAFLIADNRISELGSTDDEQLATMLRDLRIADALEGTGYTVNDVNALDKGLARLAARIAEEAPGEFPPLHPDGLKTEYCCPACGYEWSGARKPITGGEAIADANGAQPAA